MSIVKKLLIFSFLLPSVLAGMETSVVQLPLQNKDLSLKRFPIYYYIFGVHPCHMEGVGDCSKETLNTTLSSISPQKAPELLNFCVALRVAQAVLLTRPVQEWTLSDLKKINALLMHDLGDDLGKGLEVNYNLGKFKKKPGMLFRETTSEANLHSLDTQEKVDLLNCFRKINSSPGSRLAECLTTKEQKIYDKYLIRISDCCDIPGHMKEYLEHLKGMAEQGLDHFAVGGYAHIRLTQIHPFTNANGRLARILLNCILMQKGCFPFVMNEKLYDSMIKAGDLDSVIFEKLLKCFVNLSMSKCDFSLGNHDLEGDSLYEISSYDKELRIAFNDIFLEFRDFEERIGALKHHVMEKLGISTSRSTQKVLSIKNCLACTKEQDLLSCSRCKEAQYCSRECQKKDWPSHKKNCQQKTG